MCDPATALFITQGAQTGLNYFIEEKQAKEAQKFQSRVAASTSKAVIEDTLRQNNILGRRTVEEDRAASRAIMQIVRDAAAARGETEVGAGASGIDGISKSTTLRDFAAQELIRIQVAREQRETAGANIQNQKEAISAQGERTIAGSLGSPVNRPNPWQALFQIAAAGAQAGMNSRSNIPNPGSGPEWTGYNFPIDQNYDGR